MSWARVSLFLSVEQNTCEIRANKLINFEPKQESLRIKLLNFIYHKQTESQKRGKGHFESIQYQDFKSHLKTSEGNKYELI